MRRKGINFTIGLEMLQVGAFEVRSRPACVCRSRYQGESYQTDESVHLPARLRSVIALCSLTVPCVIRG